MILKFIDRCEELKALDRAFDSEKAEFYVIYGRRRLGKTELILHFLRDKTHFYFLAKEQDLELEFDRFKQKFSKKHDIYLGSREWEGLFSDITDKIKERLIVVIDEFSYWIAKDRAIVSEFQYLWDEVLKEENIFLILCGSYVSLMETDVLGYKSPLYGRRTGQIMVEPMNIICLKDFFPDYSMEDLVRVFSCLDTVPYYLSQFNPGYEFWENVRNVLLNKINPLYRDAEILLSYELREPNIYFNIMRAILEGSTKLGEIANSAKVDVTNMPKYLNRLVKLRMIRKLWPITSPKEKRALYELTDNYFRFWLTYVYPYQEEIEDSPEHHLDFIRQRYPEYVGRTFERFCMLSLRRIYPGRFNKVGRWWYKDREIDIVAMNNKTTELLFCECKWQDGVNARRVLQDLRCKAEEVKWRDKGRNETYAIFAKSFDQRVEEEDVALFDLEDMRRRLAEPWAPLSRQRPS